MAGASPAFRPAFEAGHNPSARTDTTTIVYGLWATSSCNRCCATVAATLSGKFLITKSNASRASAV